MGVECLAHRGTSCRLRPTSLEELEAVAEKKGGIRRLLDEKWSKVYKASAPRGLFTAGGLRQAA